MDRKGLTEKEAALLAAARREVAARKPEAAPQANPAARSAARPASSASSRPVARPAAAAPHLSPDPFPDTVIGWDHPAAQQAAPSAADEKWARIAALMEVERLKAQAQRDKMRKLGIGILAVSGFCLFVLAAMSALPFLRG